MDEELKAIGPERDEELDEREIVLQRVELKGTLRVGKNTIIVELPNPKGLTLQDFDDEIRVRKDFCGGCHGVITMAADAIYLV